MAYENKHNWTIGQNKPNSNPIKPNIRKAKMNVNLTITKYYRKNDNFTVRINKPNFFKGQNEIKILPENLATSSKYQKLVILLGILLVALIIKRSGVS